MTDTKLLRLPAVLEQTGLSRSELYRKMQRGEFPRAFLVPGNARTKVWNSDEVQTYVDGIVANAEREVAHV